LIKAILTLGVARSLCAMARAKKRCEVGMDQWAESSWMDPWLSLRLELPVGAVFCVIDERTRGRRWGASSVRQQLRRTAARPGARRRFAPRQLRHAHAVEMAREGMALNVIQPQLGHANLEITSVESIDNAEVIDTVHARRAPMISASAGLRAVR
jgi:integrase/recombinase XerD